MLTLHCDVQFTRRKRLYFVCDDTETPLWSGAKFSDALEYVIDSGETVLRIIGPEGNEIANVGLLGKVGEIEPETQEKT